MANSTKLKISAFLSSLYFYVPVFTLFLVDNEVTIANIIFAQVLYSIFAFSFEIPTGVLADKLGQKQSIMLGHFLDALGLLLILIFPTISTLYIAQSLRGISGAALSGSNEALMYEYIKKEKGVDKYKKEYSTFLSNAILGFALSTFIAGIILEFFPQGSYQYLFSTTILFLLINILLIFSIQNLKVKIKDKTKGKQLFYELGRSWNLIKKSQVLKALTLTVMLTYAGKYFLMESYQPYFEINKVRPFFIGSVVSVGSIINFFVIKYSYLLEKRIILPGIILLISGSIALGYVLFGAFQNPVSLVASFVLIFSLIGAEGPVMSDFINSNIPSDIRSTALSGISFSKEFAKVLLKLFLGFAVGVVGISSTYILYGSYIFIGAIISALILSKSDCIHVTHRRLSSQR